MEAGKCHVRLACMILSVMGCMSSTSTRSPATPARSFSAAGRVADGTCHTFPAGTHDPPCLQQDPVQISITLRLTKGSDYRPFPHCASRDARRVNYSQGYYCKRAGRAPNARKVFRLSKCQRDSLYALELKPVLRLVHVRNLLQFIDDHLLHLQPCFGNNARAEAAAKIILATCKIAKPFSHLIFFEPKMLQNVLKSQA